MRSPSEINDKGLPEYCDRKDDTKEDQLVSLFESIMREGVAITYQDLKLSIINSTGKTERTAERKIKEAVEMNVIIKNQVGNYFLPIQNKENDETLPF